MANRRFLPSLAARSLSLLPYVGFRFKYVRTPNELVQSSRSAFFIDGQFVFIVIFPVAWRPQAIRVRHFGSDDELFFDRANFVA